MNFLAVLIGATLANLIMSGVYGNFDWSRICFIYAFTFAVGYPLTCFINQK